MWSPKYLLSTYLSDRILGQSSTTILHLALNVLRMGISGGGNRIVQRVKDYQVKVA